MPDKEISKHKQRVLRLPKNGKGRDLIITDPHGAYDLVWSAMKAADFNPSSDRLLVGGDLIDRGAGSARASMFLRKPYVHSIAGNHERMLVDAWRQGALDRDIIDALARMNYNGMRWMKNVSIAALEEMAAEFDELPFVMEVETSRGLVGIVHADVPPGMDWKTFTEKIEAGDEYATRMALGMDLSDSFHESRQRVQNRRSDGVPGIGRVFVGHTVLFEGMQKLGNVYCLDTGSAWADAGKNHGHLTMVDPRMQTSYLTQPPAVLAATRVDLRISGSIPTTPFADNDYVDCDEYVSPKM
ncbi:metallophosphoesterase [Janthinobacterium lividum]